MGKILHALNIIKDNKSTGSVGIPILKLMLKQLNEIFNTCIQGTEVPKERKLTYVSSIYQMECENYEGIGGTSSVGRLYKRTLKKIN